MLLYPFTNRITDRFFGCFSICQKMATQNEDLIPHIVGDINNDLYAIPVKKFSKTSPPEKCNEIISPDQEWDRVKDVLPPGWEKHEGKFYCF